MMKILDIFSRKHDYAENNNMNVKIRMSADVYNRLRAYHLAADKRFEAISYLWARVVETPSGVVVLIPHNARVIMFAQDCFENQSSGNARLHRDVLNGMLIDFASSDYNCLVNVHDHWFASAGTSFSGIDDGDDIRFDRYLRDKFEPMLEKHSHIGRQRPIYNVAIVLAQQGIDARLVDTRKATPFTAAIVNIIGEHFHRLNCTELKRHSAAVYDRQKDFISPDHQTLLAECKVVLAGAGGMGSILAESLGRHGFGELRIFDDDRLSISNMNRWQGGLPGDLGQMKVDILAERLRKMFPDTTITAIPKSLFDPDVEPLLGDADIIIGALDNDAARYFLNRVAVQYGIPYFDAGVAVIADKEQAVDFLTRYYAVVPGCTACLACTKFKLYDEKQTLNAFLDEATLNARRAAGYIVDQPELSAPSVYSLNQKAASVLMTELLNYFCGWRPLATIVSEKWHEYKVQRADRDNFPEFPDRECPICSYYSGTGNTEPLPRPAAFGRIKTPITIIEKGGE